VVLSLGGENLKDIILEFRSKVSGDSEGKG